MCMQDTVSGVDMYVDDTAIFDTNVSKAVIEPNLQSAFNNLNKWCLNNGMFYIAWFRVYSIKMPCIITKINIICLFKNIAFYR